ncbi:MAG: hypothetical protein KJ709_09150 [Nanoarchaeota archaeon]|nr:hypothetical protein [Nanoarchaeota archaeon]
MKIDGLKDVYNKCIAGGRFFEKNAVDDELIRSLKDIADKGLDFTRRKMKDIPQDSPDWTFVFRDHYEALRSLIEAFLLFDRIEAENHQCMNAYLCHKHPGLDLDWEFLETIRLKRNAINYRGHLMQHDDWKRIRLQLELYITTLMKEIEVRLARHE